MTGEIKVRMIFTFIYGLLIGIVITKWHFDKPTVSHTCNCPTYKDFLNKQAKYEMFVDSLQNNGNKNNRNRLIDSIQKYRQ